MTRNPKISLPLLGFSALGLEVSCWSGFFCSISPALQQGMFFFLHTAGSVAGGAFMAGILPLQYRRQPLSAFCLFFCICLFIPGLGLAGLLLAVWPALYSSHRPALDGYRQVSVPELPYKPLKVQEQLIYGQAGMVSVLRHSQDPDRRIRAVMATRQMTSQEAIPVLKEALRDPVDDVRLLAYSMLDSKEEEINATIRSLRLRLENIGQLQRGDVHERISNRYWELAFLGLAQGEVLRHALNRSLYHLEQAIEAGGGEPGLHIQYGRLLMHQKRWEDASHAFATAVANGVPEMSVAPYLAEIAFEKREFDRVIAQIGRLGPSIRKSERLAAVSAYWT
jgi:hypothetical protein